MLSHSRLACKIALLSYHLPLGELIAELLSSIKNETWLEVSLWFSVILCRAQSRIAACKIMLNMCEGSKSSKSFWGCRRLTFPEPFDSANSDGRATFQRKTYGKQGKTLWDARKDEGPKRELVVIALSNTQGVNNTVSAHRVVEISNLRADANIMEAYKTARKDCLIEKDGRCTTDGQWKRFHSFLTATWDPGFKKHLAIIAQHMGLLLLCLTDSIIIPLNTTQYALELDSYLDEVEALLSSPNVQDKTSPALTILLDIEKADAEKHFKKLRSKMPSFPGNAKTDSSCKTQSPLSRRLKKWIKGIFGVDHQKQKEAFMTQSWESLLSGSESSEDEDRTIAGWLEHRLSRYLGIYVFKTIALTWVTKLRQLLELSREKPSWGVRVYEGTRQTLALARIVISSPRPNSGPSYDISTKEPSLWSRIIPY
ncbi:hypothetical protein BDP27DRAFT_1404315 [Rhodocollybia butyracea]|uniref:Uncharacterized protein n=1 Tax=Rhodocollybia butyracea TaxID=206335 RepID=A0A9P5PNN4_9AGAR|nr:hypothetical protein BDP27DRAFT_1404315 [Rhodocollybia butyracea]